jgi:ATP-dependent exoDNAse (exonuclease V) beta subunit
VKFRYSFRSAPIVLDAVDTVFRRARLRRPDRSRGATVHRRCAPTRRRWSICGR